MAKVIVKAKKSAEPEPKPTKRASKSQRDTPPTNLTREEQRRLNWENAHGNSDHR